MSQILDTKIISYSGPFHISGIDWWGMTTKIGDWLKAPHFLLGTTYMIMKSEKEDIINCINSGNNIEINKMVNKEDVNDKDLIMMLIKQNTQLIDQNAELAKNGTHNTTNSHNTISNNKTFVEKL